MITYYMIILYDDDYIYRLIDTCNSLLNKQQKFIKGFYTISLLLVLFIIFLNTASAQGIHFWYFSVVLTWVNSFLVYGQFTCTFKVLLLLPLVIPTWVGSNQQPQITISSTGYDQLESQAVLKGKQNNNNNKLTRS